MQICLDCLCSQAVVFADVCSSKDQICEDFGGTEKGVPVFAVEMVLVRAPQAIVNDLQTRTDPGMCLQLAQCKFFEHLTMDE